MPESPAETSLLDGKVQAIRGARLAELARRQGGVVSSAQLWRLGFSETAVAHLVARGHLLRLHRGVYAVGHLALGVFGRRFGAVLAGGDGTLVARRSAGAAWDLRAGGPARIEILAPGKGRRSIRGLDVHVTRRLPDEERAEVGGLPVTSVSRTLADLAGCLAWDDLRRTMERADALELLDVEALLRCARNRAGAPRIRAILDDWSPARTHRGLEEKLLALVRRSGLPEPAVNVDLLDFEVDLLWSSSRLVVEADSRAFHNSWAAAERDRHRDAVLAAGGYRVLRFTWRQVTKQPREVLAAIRAVL